LPIHSEKPDGRKQHRLSHCHPYSTRSRTTRCRIVPMPSWRRRLVPFRIYSTCVLCVPCGQYDLCWLISKCCGPPGRCGARCSRHHPDDHDDDDADTLHAGMPLGDGTRPRRSRAGLARSSTAGERAVPCQTTVMLHPTKQHRLSVDTRPSLPSHSQNCL